jgi:hypothetical protein
VGGNFLGVTGGLLSQVGTIAIVPIGVIAAILISLHPSTLFGNHGFSPGANSCDGVLGITLYVGLFTSDGGLAIPILGIYKGDCGCILSLFVSLTVSNSKVSVFIGGDSIPLITTVAGVRLLLGFCWIGVRVGMIEDDLLRSLAAKFGNVRAGLQLECLEIVGRVVTSLLGVLILTKLYVYSAINAMLYVILIYFIFISCDIKYSSYYVMNSSSIITQTVTTDTPYISPIVSTSNFTQPVQEPINVYRVRHDDHVTGWILLSLFLGILTTIFLLLWILCINNTHTQPPPSQCFGPFGVEAGVDAEPLNLCGTSNTDPCIFGKTSLAEAEAECDTLRSICNAFTYNVSTSTMKIVRPTNTFSSSADLFVRQSGTIS